MDERTFKRFTAKVMILPSGCMEWTAATRHDYGQLWVDGKGYAVHRLSYEHFIGPIELDNVDHTCHDPAVCHDKPCRHRLCVNPTHLEDVTHQENTRRGGSLAAKRARQTHCKFDHEFTPENTRVSKRNQRTCITCERERRSASHG